MVGRLPRILLLIAVASILIGCGGQVSSNSAGTDQVPPPPRSATVGSIKHVIVVIMQNQSFDHLFGTFPGVDGIREGVPGYQQQDAKGNTVKPYLLTSTDVPDLPHGRNEYLDVYNSGAMDKFAYYNGDVAMGYWDDSVSGVDRLWSWARQYALADKFFTTVMSSAPTNQLFMVAADDNDWPWSVQPYYGPCTNDVVAKSPYTFKNIGDQLKEKGISWGWFQANLWDCQAGYIAQQNPFEYFTSTHDSPNLMDLSVFDSQLQAGTLPAVSFVNPAPVDSMHPGSGPASRGLLWLDSFLTTVKSSSIWSDCAVIVIWDEAGGWYDHVPPPQVDSQGLGMRVPLLVVSPFAKQGYVSHVQMDNVSILKFIQTIWGLPTLNARNQSSNDLSDMFR